VLMTVQGRLKRYTEVICEVRRFDDMGGLAKGNTEATEEYVSWLSANGYTDSYANYLSSGFDWLHKPDVVDIGVDIGRSEIRSHDDNHASHSSTPERFFKYLSHFYSDDKQERPAAFPAQSLILLTPLALLLLITPSLSWRLSMLALVCTLQYMPPWCTRALVAQSRKRLERWAAKRPARD